MYIAKLALDDFRSWRHLVLDLQPGTTVLYGANGLGKTNIVEAIELLATGSSHRVHSTLPLIRAGMNKAVVRAKITQTEHHTPNSDPSSRTSDITSSEAADEVPNVAAHNRVHTTSDTLPDKASTTASETTYEVTLAAKGANRARINGGKSLYMRDIVGTIPAVIFAPEDQRLIMQDPSLRRNFLNQAGVILQPQYFSIAQEYTQIARQRTALLKTLQQRDESTDITGILQNLEVWTGKFIEVGLQLTAARMRIIEQLQQPFHTMYTRLAAGHGDARLTYEPSFEEYTQFHTGHESNPQAIREAISDHFRRIYPGEVSRGQNLIGPHRDEVQCTLNGMSAKEYASNGEAWTLALALKMALCQVIEEHSGEDAIQPIIILDDVFAQLDMTRRQQIMDFALQKNQVIITTAALNDVPDDIHAHMIDVQELLLREQQDDELHHVVAQMVAQQSSVQ